MFNSSSFSRKQKKLFAFLLLLVFVSSGLLGIVHETKAIINPLTHPIDFMTFGYTSDMPSPADAVVSATKNAIGTAFKDTTNAIIVTAMSLPMYATGTIAGLAHGLLGAIMDPQNSCIGGETYSDPSDTANYGKLKQGCLGGWKIGTSYTHIGTGDDDNPAVSAGWPLCRDLANMFIVLGFVIIGIATSLRIRTYEAKQLLPKLILAAILINFSLLICGLVIDASNITMTYFGLAGGGFGKNFMTSIDNSTKIIVSAWSGNQGSPLATLGMCIGITIFNIIAAVIFFLFFFIFLFRTMALWILVTLSPLAFVCAVFPFSKKFYDKWSDTFLQWCIIGIPASFFLWLGDVMTTKMIKAAGTDVKDISFTVYLAPAAMLFIGFLFTLEFSQMGAKAAIAAGKWVGKKGGGAVKELSSRSASGEKIQNIKSGYGRTMERIGLRTVGATATANSKQVDEKASSMAKEYTAAKATGDTATVDRIRQHAINGRGFQGAAAMKVISDAKDVSRTFGDDEAGLQKASVRMANAEAFGATGIRSAAEKLDPRLAGYNPQTIKNQTAADIAKHGSAKDSAIANAYARTNVGDIRNFSAEALKDPAFAKNTSINKIERASIEMSSAQVAATREGIKSEGMRIEAARDKYKPGTALYNELDKRNNELHDKYKAVRL